MEDYLIKMNIGTHTSLDMVCHKLERTNNPRKILKIKIWQKIYRRIPSKAWITLKYYHLSPLFLIVVRLLSHVQLFTAPWTAAGQASLCFTISRSLLKLMSNESVMPSNHLIYISVTIQLVFPKVKLKVKLFICVQHFVTPWTIQSMEFSRPEY